MAVEKRSVFNATSIKQLQARLAHEISPDLLDHRVILEGEPVYLPVVPARLGIDRLRPMTDWVFLYWAPDFGFKSALALVNFFAILMALWNTSR